LRDRITENVTGERAGKEFVDESAGSDNENVEKE
jgi:hypothetical protein